jgi:GPH family glycoside/pentoside/hexuronide:cation symporter
MSDSSAPSDHAPAAKVLPYATPVELSGGPVVLDKGYSASSATIHLWASGAIADYWMYAQFAAITLIFTTIFHVKPVYIGIALFFPRIIDGFLDPVMGHLSDITHTRWGRRRPFLVVTAVLGSFLSMALWWASPKWHPAVQAIWVGVGALLLFAMWGTYTMAHSALGYELSDDYNDRSRVFAIKSVYFSLMSVGGGYFYFLAL